jgi:hypothetical protein
MAKADRDTLAETAVRVGTRAAVTLGLGLLVAYKVQQSVRRVLHRGLVGLSALTAISAVRSFLRR